MSAAPRVVVFDYEAGNVHSACKALARVGADVTLTDEPQKVLDADGVLVPGVGAFGYVMDKFRAHGGDELILERVLARQPILGICVGMQILFAASDEKGDHSGLAVFSGQVERLRAKRLPNMGWSQLHSDPGALRMLTGVEREYFYFVHSYAHRASPVRNLRFFQERVEVATAVHEESFVAAVESGAVWATQFHPEKSGQAGLALLRNWVLTLGKERER